MRFSFERHPHLAKSSQSLDAKREGTSMTDRYGWEGLCEAAILETDDAKLPQCIREAKAAIDVRLHEMQLGHGGMPEERRAIADALAALNVLRRERV
jgi:hypothetical protein